MSGVSHSFFAGFVAFAQKRRPATVPNELARQLAVNGIEGRLRATKVDLNGDGRPEVIVQGGCAAVGNCSTLVFAKTRNGYRELLDDEAQLFWIGRGRSNGYYDVVFRVHESAYDFVVSTYRFDGQRYHVRSCLAYSYAYIDRSGRHRILKSPRIKKC